VRIERGPIGPTFEKHETQAVVRIDGDAVFEAAGLAARTRDVLETRRAQGLEGIGTSSDGTSDDEHGGDLPASVGQSIVARCSETTQ